MNDELSYEGDACDQCGNQYDDGDGKECPGCHRMLCYLHFPATEGGPNPDAVCKRCAKKGTVTA